MIPGPFHTNYRVWFFATACVFVALGYVNPSAGVAWVDSSLWRRLFILLSGDYFCSTADMLDPIVLWAIVLMVPAVVFGWVFQAFLIILWSVVRDNPPGRGAASRYQGVSAGPTPKSNRPGE